MNSFPLYLWLGATEVAQVIHFSSDEGGWPQQSLYSHPERSHRDGQVSVGLIHLGWEWFVGVTGPVALSPSAVKGQPAAFCFQHSLCSLKTTSL